MKNESESSEIHIEVCQNCRLHRWCTRHNEKKYNQIFESVAQAINKELGPSYKVLKNPNNPKPRIGAFEVTYKDKVIFSKITKGCFPEPSAVGLKAKEIVEGKQSEKKEEEKKQGSPEKKPVKKLNIKTAKEPDSKIPKYDIICPSPTKVHRAYKVGNEGFSGLAFESSTVHENKN